MPEDRGDALLSIIERILGARPEVPAIGVEDVVRYLGGFADDEQADTVREVLLSSDELMFTVPVLLDEVEKLETLPENEVLLIAAEETEEGRVARLWRKARSEHLKASSQKEPAFVSRQPAHRPTAAAVEKPILHGKAGLLGIDLFAENRAGDLHIEVEWMDSSPSTIAGFSRLPVHFAMRTDSGLTTVGTYHFEARMRFQVAGYARVLGLQPGKVSPALFEISVGQGIVARSVELYREPEEEAAETFEESESPLDL